MDLSVRLHPHAVVTHANYETASKSRMKLSGCARALSWLHHNVSLLRPSITSRCVCVCVCVLPPSSSKGSSTTVWASTWRTSLTSLTVWLPTIDGFTTNTTLTTSDRYTEMYSVLSLFLLEVHINNRAHIHEYTKERVAHCTWQTFSSYHMTYMTGSYIK